MDPEKLAELERLLTSHESVVHATHVNPDADGLGSALAFSRALALDGRTSVVAVSAPLPRSLDFLVRTDEVAVLEASEPALPADAVWILYDVSTTSRLGPLAAAAEAAPARVVFDHHDAADEFPGLAFVDASAGATAEVVHDILAARGVEMSIDLALPLYVALLTDTGSFNYGKTTPRTHAIAGRLLEAGVDPLEVHGLLSGRRSLPSVRAAGRVMTTLSLDANDPRLGHATVTRDVRHSAGPDGLDTSELVNSTISVEGTLAGVLFVETDDGSTRLSFRSKGRTSILEVARSLGGGGHRNAAGAQLDGPPGEVRERVLALLREELERQHGPVASA